MAEAAGLVVGTIALATLFQTALDFLDCLEDAKNLTYDRKLGDTKIRLLEIRLKQWGEDMHVLHPGQEDGGLREHWMEESGTVANCLLGIAEILSTASELSCKYDVYKKTGFVWSSIFRPRGKPRSLQYLRTLGSLRQRASWAIRDKKRFDALVVELDFLITNLEKVSRRLPEISMVLSPRILVYVFNLFLQTAATRICYQLAWNVTR
jgi:hypothetical protein